MAPRPKAVSTTASTRNILLSKMLRNSICSVILVLRKGTGQQTPPVCRCTAKRLGCGPQDPHAGCLQKGGSMSDFIFFSVIFCMLQIFYNVLFYHHKTIDRSFKFGFSKDKRLQRISELKPQEDIPWRVRVQVPLVFSLYPPKRGAGSPKPTSSTHTHIHTHAHEHTCTHDIPALSSNITCLRTSPSPSPSAVYLFSPASCSVPN